MRRRILTAAAVIGAAALAAAPNAMAKQGINGCTLHGQADFANPLFGPSSSDPTGGSNFTYSFSGTLSNCQSSSGGPTDGTITAGAKSGLPTATGTGSCGSSTTSGISVVKWKSGTFTVVKYATTGYTAAVALTGSVVASVQQDTFTKDQSGNEIYQTISTNEPATAVGDHVGGALAFEPPDPTACGPTGAGVSTAGIDGAIGTGNYQ